MRLSEIGELSLLEAIRDKFKKKTKEIIVGIGDDAAVTKPKGKKLLFTTDMMVEGIHFDLRFTSPYQLGFKLVSVNVSDIYAMGGMPQYLLLNIAMNKNTEKSFIDKFFDGIEDSMRLYRVSLIGGDLCSTKKDMVISASLTGYIDKPIRRSGAKVGDKIYVTGNLGDSACGLEMLKHIRIQDTRYRIQDTRCTIHDARYRIKIVNHESCIMNHASLSKLGLTWHIVKPLLKRHLMPVARNPRSFMRYATAMIDISDGLFIDLSRLCNESKVGARIYLDKIPISKEMKYVAKIMGLDPLHLATSGGEDYELLFTSPPEVTVSSKQYAVSSGKKVPTAYSLLPTPRITCIGEITRKDRIIIDKIGKESKLRAEGYQHFGIQR
jgi:thiamine-monophosphate kinase